jgi:hypothetical protein
MRNTPIAICWIHVSQVLTAEQREQVKKTSPRRLINPAFAIRSGWR